MQRVCATVACHEQVPTRAQLLACARMQSSASQCAVPRHGGVHAAWTGVHASCILYVPLREHSVCLSHDCWTPAAFPCGLCCVNRSSTLFNPYLTLPHMHGQLPSFLLGTNAWTERADRQDGRVLAAAYASLDLWLICGTRTTNLIAQSRQ